MLQASTISILAFGATSVLVVIVFALLSRGRDEARTRLRDLAGPSPQTSAWARVGRKFAARCSSLASPLLPGKEKERTQLTDRLRQAGIYHPDALLVFLGLKALFLIVGAGIGLLIGLILGWLPLRLMLVGLGVGLILPGVLLGWKIGKRRDALRAGLSDVLDMLVLCLEGGLSLSGALQRVTAELQYVHPELTTELSIAEREMLMGSTAPEALARLGERCDLEEVRSLAAVLLQSQKFGASVVKTMRLYADMLRTERQQRAEEHAQKAAVKILFPTLLCIFPAIFVVILGPAAFQIKAIFGQVVK